MLRKEWPLIMNTLLAQLAAGMFIFLTIDRMMLLSGTNQSAALQFTRPGMMLVGPIIALAMILSLFHLGNPLRAYRSIANIGKSWLSWEVFFSGVFFVLWVICCWMDQTGMASPYLLGLTALAGLLNVFSMANIYFTTGRPGWASSATVLSFLGSLIILGSLGSTLVFVNNGMDAAAIVSLATKPVMLAILVLALEFIFQVAFLSKLKSQGDADNLNSLVSSFSVDEAATRQYRYYSIAGWFLSLLGVILLFINLLGAQVEPSTMLIAFLLVIIGELLGRCAFFSLGF